MEKNDTWSFQGSKIDGWILDGIKEKQTGGKEEKRKEGRRKEGRKDVNTSVF